MSKTWFDYLVDMPEEIRNVALEMWDETGRPRHEHSYPIAMGRLLDLSDDYDGFIERYKQLFPERDVVVPLVGELHNYWMCYVYGMKRLERDLFKVQKEKYKNG